MVNCDGGSRLAPRLRKCGSWLSQVVALAAVLVLGSNSTLTAQTWTQLTGNYPLFNSGNMVLLTDGTVLVQGAEGTNRVSAKWVKLTPDSKGNYVNGTWSNVAPMNIKRVNFSTWVLPNGKVVAMGGQYSQPVNGIGNPTPWDSTVEIYDPVADTWTQSFSSYPGGALSDSPTLLTPTGVIMAGDFFSNTTYIYNPTTDSWGVSGNRADPGELWVTGETWTLLPDKTVVSYDSVASFTAFGPYYAERYSVLGGTWSDAGPVPIPVNDSSNNLTPNEWVIGPASVTPDGKVIQFGAPKKTQVVQTVIFDPSALPATAWIPGPSLPLGTGCDDTPGCMLPNGLFLVAADVLPKNGAPTKLYTYDYTNTVNLTDVTPATPVSLVNNLATTGGINKRMLMLPNGNMLFSTGNGQFYEYTPASVFGNPQSTWRPTVSPTIVRHSLTSYTITGTRFNGISSGASFGGSFNNSATNFPVLKLKNNANGLVKYAQVTGWTPGVQAVGDSTPQSLDFIMPTGFGAGSYTLNVVANGIPSADTAFNVSVQTNNVNMVYDAKNQIITLTGDTDDNNVQITLKNQVLTFTGSNKTQIVYNGSPATSQSIHFGTNLNLAVALTINGSFLGGNDFVTLSGVTAKSVKMDMGVGSDTFKVSLSNIASVTGIGSSGGFDPGTDTFGRAGSKISSLSLSGFEVILPP